MSSRTSAWRRSPGNDSDNWRCARRKEGYVLSCPLDSAGKPASVFLNVSDLSPDNALTVEINDPAGRPLSKFCGKECVPVTESGFRVPVRWKSAERVADTGPFAIRMRSAAKAQEPQLHALYVSS